VERLGRLVPVHGDTSVPPATATLVSPPTGPGAPVTFRLKSTAVDVATAQAQIVTAEPVSPDVWSHLVGVYDPGRQQGRLYVDGALAGTASVTWKPVTSTGPLQVGRALRGGVQGEYLRGRVDDLSAYQGAMTDAQVRTLHGSEVIEAEES
jgi:hypothetical protein